MEYKETKFISVDIILHVYCLKNSMINIILYPLNLFLINDVETIVSFYT